MIPVAVPDYLGFGVPSTLTDVPCADEVPVVGSVARTPDSDSIVIGNRDPLISGPARVEEVASQTDNHVSVVVIDGAAHAINFSHPGELANVIRLFMADKPIVDDPDSPGHATAYEIHRGVHLPPHKPLDKTDEQVS